MQTRADIVIIGGGIIGVSVAYHLAKEKLGRIVLVEKEPLLGTGATSKAAGGIRAQFSTRVNIEMSMLSEKLFEQFEEDTGAEAHFDQVGYIFLLGEDHLEKFRRQFSLQQSLGLAVEWLKPNDIEQYAPHVSLDGIVAATFCGQDGLGDPHQFLTGYEKVSRRLGVDFVLDNKVTGINISGGKVVSISTSQGPISTPLVIDCAGPQSKLIGEMAGVQVKVEPVRRQIVTTGELSFIKPNFPMVVDVASGLYCHKESQGLLLGWADPSTKPSFDISLDPDYTDAILEKGLYRIPLLEEAEIANQWAGLYEITPDHHAIIGYQPSLEGLFHVTGFSGHGFMQAPAAGLVTSQILTGKKTSVEIASLSPERFYNGVLTEETNVI